MGAALGYSSSMAGLEGLTHFDLSHNNLSGVVPSQVRTSPAACRQMHAALTLVCAFWKLDGDVRCACELASVWLPVMPASACGCICARGRARLRDSTQPKSRVCMHYIRPHSKDAVAVCGVGQGSARQRSPQPLVARRPLLSYHTV